MKRILILTLFTISLIFKTLNGQDLIKGFKLINRGKITEAKQFFDLNNNFCLSKAGLLRILNINNQLSTESELRDAYNMAYELIRCYNALSDREKNKHKKYISGSSIDDLFRNIDNKYYYFTIRNHDIKQCELYLKTCKNSKYYQTVLDFTDSCEFSRIKTINTIDAYKAYLNKYSPGRFQNEAFSGIEELYYLNLKRENTLSSYNVYLDNYPSGKYKQEVLSLAEEPVFLKSKKENIENSYNTYLIKYPNGKYIKEAYEAIELTVYSNAIKNNTLEAYNAYLNRYPKGKYSKQAGKSVEILYYLNSKSEETENAYKSYLNKYPSGKYSKKALAAIERIIFREAKNQFSKESFDVYIKRFPNGRYKIDIKEMLAGRTQVQTLINDLRDSDWIKQRDAAEKLGNIGDPRAVEPLLELLKADVFVASDEAAHALGKIANPGAVEPLIKELKSYRIGQNAATALGEIGDRRAINQLIATSNFSALGKIGDPRTTKILIDALTNKSSSDKREIIIALGDIEDPLAIDPLINILNRGDSQRSIVAEALVKIEASREIDSLVFINNLKDENIMVRRDAIKSLDSMRVIPVGDNAYYYYIVKSGKDYINKNWTVIKQLLLDNMIAGRYEDYSLRMFFWVGKNEVIPDLIDIMNNQHDTYMPELFLNCGQSQLSRAAKTWAKNHGYTIYSRSGSATRYWGQ